MSDTIPVVSQPAASSQQLTQDMLNTLDIGHRVKAAMAAGGSEAVLKELGLDLPQIEGIAQDAIAAIPSFKTGWKTSEFWVTILSLPVVNALWLVLFKTHAPPDINGAVTVLATGYVGSRAVVKHAQASTNTMKTAQVSKVETVSQTGDLKSTMQEITSSGPAPTKVT